MKKIFVLAVGFMMIASVSFADSASGANGEWFLGLALGGDIPASNWAAGTPTGGGGELYGAYMFDKNIGLQLDLDHYISSQSGVSNYTGEYTLNFKYLADGSGVQPYIFAGPGTSLSVSSVKIGGTTISASTTNFDFDICGGVQFDLGKKLYLYVEAKYNMIFAPGATASDVPILAGLNFALN